ncbi:MAG: hypothetical protein FJY54_17270 [Betaproteobacteria bacterium]|nr:hypothetical protein [Betaproteobacteria bacterium]
MESEVFRERHASLEGFFHSHRDQNTAVWSVDTQRADAWLKMRSPLYELAQAIARIKQIPAETALAAVEKAPEEKRAIWRSNAKVKATIAAIRAEKAAEAAERELSLDPNVEQPDDS